MRTLIWLRNDLRIQDNPALLAAAQAGHEEGVMALYILTPKTWQYHEAAPIKIDFILRNLADLQKKLQELNIPLQVLEAPEYKDCVALIQKLCADYKIKNVYVNAQYEIDERQRDEKVAAQLKEDSVGFHMSHGDVLITPGMILSNKEEPIKVFTPFKKKWLRYWHDFGSLKAATLTKKLTHSFAKAKAPPKALNHFTTDHAADLWPAGELAAAKHLQKFLHEHLDDYHKNRDYPALDATSRLSPYFAQGVLSVRQALIKISHHYDKSIAELNQLKGAGTWLNEIIWREFYKHIIFLFPKICCYQTLRAQYQHWPWHKDPKLLKAWSEGQTGYPLIDAGMRQLNQTGWMHNRLRMNVAMFLSKLLMLDWHLGESYFSQHLIDGDLAANNGGWQWSAGTGTDAAPYFRIFNPTLQSEQYDPEGAYIRQYCPELEDFDNKAIHAPHERNPELAKKVGYPQPIVNYKTARAKALDLLRHLK